MSSTIRRERAFVADVLRPLEALAALAASAPPLAQPGIVVEVRDRLVLTDLRLRLGPGTPSAERILGASLPSLGASSTCVEGDILRLGPDQWLLVSPPGGRWSEDLRVPGATLCDVSCGRVVVRVRGPDVRAALAKGCMLDLHEREFARGACAQTLIAKVNVIVHRLESSDPAYDLYATRSAAGSFWHWLMESAREFGCTVTRAQRNAPGGDGNG
jgi:sarcosine oxidase subunit gamma